MKILIAEDEPVMLKTLEMRLRKDGYDIITATDGKAALEQIQEQQPDLIVTDIMMPYASGLEIVGAVKKLEKKIQIIILSSIGQENVVLEAFKLGADDYITKPFNPNELSMRVKRLIISQI